MLKNCERSGSTTTTRNPAHALLRAFGLILVASSIGCVGSYGCLPEDTRIACETDVDCPQGYQCLPALSVCRNIEELQDPPVLEEWSLTPTLVGPGTEITAEFRFAGTLYPIDDEVRQNPRLYLDISESNESLALTTSSIDDDIYRYTFIPPSNLTVGPAEVKLDIVQIDGQQLEDFDLGTFELDVERPALVGALRAEPAKVVDGDVLTFSGTARETVNIIGLRVVGDETLFPLTVNTTEDDLEFIATIVVDEALPSGNVEFLVVVEDLAGNAADLVAPAVEIDRQGPRVVGAAVRYAKDQFPVPAGDFLGASAETQVTYTVVADEDLASTGSPTLTIFIELPGVDDVEIDGAILDPEFPRQVTFSKKLPKNLPDMATPQAFPAQVTWSDANGFQSTSPPGALPPVRAWVRTPQINVQQDQVLFVRLPTGFPQDLPAADTSNGGYQTIPGATVTLPAGPSAAIVPAGDTFAGDDGSIVDALIEAEIEDLQLPLDTFTLGTENVPPQVVLLSSAIPSANAGMTMASDAVYMGALFPDGDFWTFGGLLPVVTDRIFATAVDTFGNSSTSEVITHAAWVGTPGGNEVTATVRFSGAHSFSASRVPPVATNDTNVTPYAAIPFTGAEPPTLFGEHTWTLVHPSAAHPAAQNCTRVVTDPDRGVLTHVDTEMRVMDFDGFGWRERVVTSALPPLRQCFSLTYDPLRHTVLLFGGFTAYGASADLWELKDDKWRKIFDFAPVVPATDGARYSHAAAYDNTRGRLLIFGGFGNAGFLSTDVIAIDNDGWTPLTFPNAPTARHTHTMTWDPSRDVLVLAGGQTESGPDTDTVWELDLSVAEPAWVSISVPNLAPEGIIESLFSPEFDRVIFAGNTTGGAQTELRRWRPGDQEAELIYPAPGDEPLEGGYDVGFARMLDGTFVLMGTAAQANTVLIKASGLRRLSAAVEPFAPSPRFGVRAAADRVGNILLFGGAAFEQSSITVAPDAAYLFNGIGYYALEDTPAEPVTPRYGHAMVYRGETEEMILVGGRSDNGTLIPDGPHRQRMSVQGTTLNIVNDGGAGPGPRAGSAIAYSFSDDTVLLFGGAVSDGNGGEMVTDETWQMGSDGSWTLLNIAGPPARAEGRMAFVPNVGVLLFGGRETPDLYDYSGPEPVGVPHVGFSDIWLFSNGTWAPFPTVCGPSFVLVPSDPPQQDCPPPARAAPTFYHDLARGRTVLMGGSRPFTDELTGDYLGTGVPQVRYELDFVGSAPNVAGVWRRNYALSDFTGEAFYFPEPSADAAFAYVPDDAAAYIYGGRNTAGAATQYLWRRTPKTSIPSPVIDITVNVADLFADDVAISGLAAGMFCYGFDALTVDGQGNPVRMPTALSAFAADPAQILDFDTSLATSLVDVNGHALGDGAWAPLTTESLGTNGVAALIGGDDLAAFISAESSTMSFRCSAVPSPQLDSAVLPGASLIAFQVAAFYDIVDAP